MCFLRSSQGFPSAPVHCIRCGFSPVSSERIKALGPSDRCRQLPRLQRWRHWRTRTSAWALKLPAKERASQRGRELFLSILVPGRNYYSRTSSKKPPDNITQLMLSPSMDAFSNFLHTWYMWFWMRWLMIFACWCTLR